MNTNDTNKNKRQILLKELSYKITGLCFQVHNKLGRFCREKQYADRLAEYLKTTKISFKREIEITPIESNSPFGNRIDFILKT